MTKGADSNEDYFTDNDDKTCNDNPHVDTIVVSLKGPVPFMWIRIVVKNNGKFEPCCC